MARSIIVTYQGNPSSFGYSKVSRTQLYAKRKRVPLDPAGQPCQRAELSDDGSMLIVSGMTGQGYFDEGNRWVPNDQMTGIAPDGKEAPLKPSTLDTAQPLTEVEPEALLDCSTDAVYALDANELDPDLKKSLDEGKLFRFDFNMRADYNTETAFLVSNEQGIFAIIGNRLEIPWSELEKPAVELDDADDSDDGGELDFEMF